MIQHRLSNVVFRFGEFMAGHEDVYYRAQGAGAQPTEDGLLLRGAVDFLTYFNACSLAKWKRYAQVERVCLHLELEGGPCRVAFSSMDAGAQAPVALGAAVELDPASVQGGSFDVVVPACDAQLVGFSLEPSCADKPVTLRRAWFYTQVDEARVNKVRLAVATTTFRKEAYIQANIALVKAEVLAGEDEITGNFHMFVVDNGRTLDAAGLSDAGVTVIPNANVGGAGGFARGMMAALDADGTPDEYTHVLLMDDDVRVSTESLKRTFNLLRLAQGTYAHAFVNGAMLAMEEPTLQHEDVAFVDGSGVYTRIKGDVHVDSIAEVAASEATNVEVKNAYGAWWFSCIPMEQVRKNGLPLPLFVRCDDVEYGVRCQGTYMCMNGICVWHEGFSGRFRASVDCFQFARNFMVMAACHDCVSPTLFMARLGRNVSLYLRAMNYTAAELYLDGFEAYLDGPDALAAADGEGLMKGNGARNERLVPVEELEGVDMASLAVNPRMLDPLSGNLAAKLLRSLPYDRHYLPDFLLRDTPEAVLYSHWTCLAPRSAATRTLVGLDPDAKNGIVRHMDRERWRAIRKRYKELLTRYNLYGDAIRASYRQAFPTLTSREFWDLYLAQRLGE